MALTNLNALGSAIRTKVGEAEKKTLPQLKDIVDNQLMAIPTESQTFTTNGTYNVTNLAEAVVNCNEKTAEDVLNAERMAELDTFLRGLTSLKEYQNLFYFWTNPPYINTPNVTNFRGCFGADTPCIAEHITINISSATDCYRTFTNNKRINHITFIGSFGNTNMDGMFNGCTNLSVIDGDPINLSSARNTTYMFSYDEKLREVRFVPLSIKTPFILTTSPILSEASVLSVLRGLTDLTGQSTQIFEFSSEVTYDSTSDAVKQEIANAIAKNWVIKFGSRTPTGE